MIGVRLGGAALAGMVPFGLTLGATGAAQGSEFQVNTYTNSDQNFPVAAMDSAGDFVIAWQSFNEDGSN